MALFAVAGISGVVLAIVGGARLGSAHTLDQFNVDVNLRHAGLILFVVLFAGCLVLTIYCWPHWKIIWFYRRRVS